MNTIRLRARKIICQKLSHAHRVMMANQNSDTVLFKVAAKRFNELLKVSAYLTDKELAD